MPTPPPTAPAGPEWLYQVQEVAAEPNLRPRDRITRLRTVLENICRDGLGLSAGDRLSLSELLYRLHRTRRLDEPLRTALAATRRVANRCLFEGYRATDAEYQAAHAAVMGLLNALYGTELAQAPTPLPFPPSEEPEAHLSQVIYAQADALDEHRNLLLAHDDDGQPLEIEYGLKGYNAPFAGLPRYIGPALAAGRAVRLALVYPRYTPEGRLAPEFIVLEPDYLMDVTAVAECFDASGGNPNLHWINLLKPRQEAKMSLLTGQIVNGIFDSALPGQEFDLNAYLREVIFPQYPLELSLLFADPTPQALAEQPHLPTGNQKLGEFRLKLEHHTATVRAVIEEGFATYREFQHQPKGPIPKEDCLLEPSFFSPLFGIQGRLDLLYPRPSTDVPELDIVELKSGRAPSARPHLGHSLLPLTPGIHPNHEAQARLYRLLLESAYGPQVRGSIRLLYSQAEPDSAVREVQQTSRRAQGQDFFEASQWAIHLRNQLVHIELSIAQTPDLLRLERALLHALDVLVCSNTSSFVFQDAHTLLTALKALDPTERSYFFHYLRFAFADKLATKLGTGDDRSPERAQRALWTLDRQDPDHPNVLLGLTVSENQSRDGNPYPFIALNATPEALRRFSLRVGDLVVLFPDSTLPSWTGGLHSPTSDPSKEERLTGPLRTQVVRGVLAEIGSQHVKIAFRQPQHFHHYFEQHTHWALQGDVLDHSAGQMAQALVRFTYLPPETRALLLGTRPPADPTAGPQSVATETAIYSNSPFDSSPAAAIAAALSAPEYYLLVGPPGTGKTRLFLRGVVDGFRQKEAGALLLAAYTNRAVDEICEQLEDLGLDYIRIGSRHGTPERFHQHLHTQVFRACNTRALLRQRLDGLRIVIGTVASLQGQPTLFELKKFDLIVIDEAAQLLEPHVLALVGLASRSGGTPRLVMVGDPRQLPAVTPVPDGPASVQSTELQKIGLSDLRLSLFERLLDRCQTNGWHWAWGQLTHQGRMHQELMQYVGPAYYGGNLQLAAHDAIRARQTAPFTLLKALPESDLEAFIQTRRLVFIPIATPGKPFAKAHPDEASLVVRLAAYIRHSFGEHFTPETDLGIITPWRGQIAEIRRQMLETENPGLHDISIDTVERYQGSQRRCILVSLAITAPGQLRHLVHLTPDGATDRKLNVAITRAQEQLIIIGNPELLLLAPPYAALLAHIRSVGGWYGVD